MSIWFEEIFVKNCGAIVALDGRQKILIINLQRLKQAHEKNPEIFPLRACPFFTNFVLSRQITNFQEFVQYYLCIGKKNPKIKAIRERNLTQVDSQKTIKFYLQIDNLNDFPNAEIAFLI